MKRIEIRLNTKNEAEDFVARVSDCPVHIDLVCGHYIVDAKSIMGVLSVAVGKIVTLLVHPEDSRLLEEKVGRYIV